MSSEPRQVGERVSLTRIADMTRAGERIVMVTAYDHPSARMADAAGVDVILVGDSSGNNVLGYADTVPVTMDEQVMLTAAAARSRPRAFLVGDMPFGSFQPSDAEAVRNAVRLVKAGADAVKLEGAGPMLARVRAIAGAGIPVMGHIGLTPQSATKLGGFKAQGRTAAKARQLYTDAHDLQAAGCFAVVLEAVPAPVAAHISEALDIATIGIGAGAGCDGQVLVWHDLLGITAGHVPRFVKRYAEVGAEIVRGLSAFTAEVRAGAFPSEEHGYRMSDHERELFEAEVAQHEESRPGSARS